MTKWWMCKKSRPVFARPSSRAAWARAAFIINDQFVYLKGYAQRSSNDWAGLGEAYPDWMHDYTLKMMREHACELCALDARLAADRGCRARAIGSGIVEVCPGGDKEARCAPAGNGTSAWK